MLGTIRGRVAFWNFLVIALLLGAFSLLLYGAIDSHLYLEADVALEAKTEVITDHLGIVAGTIVLASDDDTLAAGVWVHVQTLDGHPLLDLNGTPYPVPTLPSELASLSEGFAWYTLNASRGELRVLTVADDIESEHSETALPVRVSVGIALENVEQNLAELRLWMWGISASLLLITNALTWLLAGRLLHPLRRMAQAADAISERQLDRRLEVPNPKDEIGQLGAAFNRLFCRLQGAFESQRRFVSDASHELRTPLAVLQGKLELALRKHRLESEYRNALQTALAQTLRLSGLVQRLLVLARADSGRLDIEPRPVRLDRLCEEACAELRERGLDKHLKLVLSVDAQPTVAGDAHLLRLALDNVLDNAVKYTPAKGEVRVAVSSDAARATLHVTDTGVGIAPEALPHVCERFYRVDPARASSVTGTGLGLAIVAEVVSLHGGELDIQSEPSKGTRVALYFPLVPRS